MGEPYGDNTLPYHFIVLSLLRYAFSDVLLLDRGFRIEDVARVMDSLMCELEFAGGYGGEGGNIGSKVAWIMAAEHEACGAAHRMSLYSFL